MKVPETVKWAIGVAALVLLPQNATWPDFLVQTSDYYAELRLTPSGQVVVISKNSGSRTVLLDSSGQTLHAVRAIAGGNTLVIKDGKIPPEAYSVVVAPAPTTTPTQVRQGDELVTPGLLKIFTPAEMTRYVVTIVILVGVAVMFALLVRDVREKAGV